MTGKERQGLQGHSEPSKEGINKRESFFQGKESLAPKHNRFKPARSTLKLEITRRFPGSCSETQTGTGNQRNANIFLPSFYF